MQMIRRITQTFKDSLRLNGGERGIRTLDRGLAYTPLAGERLQPLGHLSVNNDFIRFEF